MTDTGNPETFLRNAHRQMVRIEGLIEAAHLISSHDETRHLGVEAVATLMSIAEEMSFDLRNDLEGVAANYRLQAL